MFGFGLAATAAPVAASTGPIKASLSRIARHTTAGDNEQNQCRDAGEDNRHVGVEAHQQRRQHRRAEHRDHVLQPDQDGRAGRQPLLGQITPSVLTGHTM